MDTRAEPGYAARWTIEDISGEKTVTEAEWLKCTKDPKRCWSLCMAELR